MPITRQTYFSPTQISGCSLWLDAADSTATGSGVNVTTWLDKSGNGKSTTSYGGTPSISSSAINGKQAIYFNGSSYFTGAISGANTTTITVFIIGSLISPFTSFSGLLCFGNPSQLDYDNVGSLPITMYNAESALYAARNSSSQKTPISAGVPFIYVLQYDGTYINTWLNGTQQTDPSTNIASSGTFTYTNYSVANRAGTTGNYIWSGYLGEILVYQNALIISQRRQIEGYLAQKWGLTSSLPAGHPGLTSIVYRNLQTTFTKTPYYTAFSPKSVPNCLIWFDAADSSTLGLTGTTVNTWTSKGSYTGNAAADTGTVSYGTVTQNGLNVVRFPAGTQLTFTLAMPNQARAIFIVGRNTTQMSPAGNPPYYWSLFNTNAGTGYDSSPGPYAPSGVGGTSTYTMQLNKNGVGNMLASAGTIADPYMVWNTYEWINSAVSTSSNFLMINGNSVTLTANNLASGYFTTSFTRTLNLASLSTGSDIAEVLIYNGEITATQRQQVESYLAQKWGLVSSLPSGHLNATFPAGSPTAIQAFTTSIKPVVTSVVKVLTMINAFPTSTNNWQCTFVSSDASFIVAFANGPYTVNCGYPYTSVDKGITFTAQKSAGQISWYYCAGSDNGSTLISSEAGYLLYVSVNSGVTMTPQTSLGNKGWTGYACSSNASLLVAVANGSGIYTSTNQGTSWTTTSAGASSWNWCCCSGDGTYVYTTLANSYVYKSSNSGSTWSALTGSGARNWQGLCCSKDGSKIYGTAYNGYIYFSSDYGVTWASQSVSTTWGPICCSYDGTKAFAAVSPGLIYATINSGTTWTTNIVNNTLTSEGWKGISCSADGTFALVASWANSPSTGLLYKIIYK